jgi:hypothetical protein
VARIGLRRLLTADQIVANIPAGTFFRWLGKIYFRGNQLTEMQLSHPMAQFRYEDGGLITENAIDPAQNKNKSNSSYSILQSQQS